MKILLLSSVYPRFEKDLEVPWLRISVRELKKNDCEVSVLAPAYKGLKNHKIDGTDVYRFRYSPSSLEILTHDEGAPSKIARNPFLQLLAIPYIISGTIKTMRLCLKLKPDIIHVHWPFPHAFMAYVARFFFKKPVVLTFYSAELLLAKKKKWIKPILKIFIKKADLIFAISKFAGDTVQKIYNRPIEFLPYGTTLDGAPRPGKIVGAKNLLPLQFRVLFVGRHIERKGIEYLIKAASMLDTNKFQIIIVGKGDLTEKLKKNAPENVVFTGKISNEELVEQYQNAGCFILPAIVDSRGDTEGLGVVLIEATQYGLPVIASDVGGIPDIIIDKQTGLLVPQKNPEAIATAIKTLAENEDLQKTLVQNAAKHIEENFSWEKIIKKQIECYLKIFKFNTLFCSHLRFERQ